MNKSCEMDTNISIQIIQRKVDWDQINWSQIKLKVDKFQQNIFRDAQAGNFRRVKQQQKLLVRSLSARLWAVHLTTEINKGRNTPGIDNCLYKTTDQKEVLVENLSIKNYQPTPTKTIWIPKTDGTNRKLGIPTIKDRAMQALVLLAMEPEWESKFEPNSFGFRPGRSAIDAVSHIWHAMIHQKDKKPHPGWILDADISKCFDNINHDSLLAKICDSPFQGTIKKWLNSGTISSIGFKRTQRGTPQGGVISPLLANIALDGLERQFGIFSCFGRYINPAARCGKNKRISLYRYADDFIVIAPSRKSITEYVIPKVKTFLNEMGLNLNEAKTNVVNISDGFKFLGFRFQRFYRKDGSIKEFAYYPERKRMDRFLGKLKFYVRHRRNGDVKELIKGLNRRIRGFCNYYKWSSTRRAFSYLSHRIWNILWRWARHRHKRKRNANWIRNRYWKSHGNNNWTFSYQGIHLINPLQMSVQWWKWPRVKIAASPYDVKCTTYWENRRNRKRKSHSSGNNASIDDLEIL